MVKLDKSVLFKNQLHTPLHIKISWAITLFIIGLIAVALGFGGVGSMALNIGWVLLAVGVILAIIHAISGRRVV